MLSRILKNKGRLSAYISGFWNRKCPKCARRDPYFHATNRNMKYNKEKGYFECTNSMSPCGYKMDTQNKEINGE